MCAKYCTVNLVVDHAEEAEFEIEEFKISEDPPAQVVKGRCAISETCLSARPPNRDCRTLPCDCALQGAHTIAHCATLTTNR